MASLTSPFAKWRRWLSCIEREQLRDLLINQHIFKQLEVCTRSYVGTYQGARLSQWMAQNYLAFASTAIRRMIEVPDRRWKSVSLRILLNDLATHDHLLTRARFKGLYRNSIARRFADRDFDSISRSKKATHVTAARIRRDIRSLENACRPVKRFVDKIVAHTEEDRRKIGRMKYGAITKAIRALDSTFQRYSLLVNGTVANPLIPLNGFDVRADLQKIWP